MVETSVVRQYIHEVGRRARQDDTPDPQARSSSAGLDAPAMGDNKAAAMIASLEVQLEDLQTELRALREECTSLRRAIARVSPDLGGPRVDRFYAAFEDAFRGSTDEIGHRAEAYLDDLCSVTAHGGRVLDLGSGRGELLARLAAEGIDAYGVDASSTMVRRCREQGLEVVLDDAVTHLQGLPPDSLGAVTGVHLVEHLGLDALLDVAEQARRVLRPGGLLILETPNPTTWHVGADLFYLDPTHLRPVHPLLLEFVLVDAGFVDIRTRMLHPYEASSPELDPAADPVVVELLHRFAAMWGGPQDYAVLGRRSSSAR